MSERVTPPGRTPEERRFLGRVAEALGRPLLTSAPDSQVRGIRGLAEMTEGGPGKALELFLANWRALGGEADVVSADRAAARAAEILGEWKGQRVVRWNDPLLDETGVDRALKDAGASVYVWRTGVNREEAIREAQRADLGITTVHWAAAEPGTVVLLSGGDTPRSVSLLPPAYLALVPASRVVPRLTRVMREAVERGLSSSLNFITGPSRTADIENDLTIGVHGPGRVYALVLEDR
ncbi:MAG: lactate utilization protein C [Kyrpidia sp.]|nr:lactate utilization protein C [Kyrpidia sp.]